MLAILNVVHVRGGLRRWETCSQRIRHGLGWHAAPFDPGVRFIRVVHPNLFRCRRGLRPAEENDPLIRDESFHLAYSKQK